MTDFDALIADLARLQLAAQLVSRTLASSIANHGGGVTTCSLPGPVAAVLADLLDLSVRAPAKAERGI